MAVVMKIADDGDAHAPFVELFDDPRHSPGGIVVVDRDSHQFGSCAGQGSHLLDGRRHVCGVGVGHGLHHDGCIRAYPHTSHHGRNGLSSWNRSHIGEPLILSPNPARTGPPGGPRGNRGVTGFAPNRLVLRATTASDEPLRAHPNCQLPPRTTEYALPTALVLVFAAWRPCP